MTRPSFQKGDAPLAQLRSNKHIVAARPDADWKIHLALSKTCDSFRKVYRVDRTLAWEILGELSQDAICFTSSGTTDVIRIPILGTTAASFTEALNTLMTWGLDWSLCDTVYQFDNALMFFQSYARSMWQMCRLHGQGRPLIWFLDYGKEAYFVNPYRPGRRFFCSADRASCQPKVTCSFINAVDSTESFGFKRMLVASQLLLRNCKHT